MPPIPELLRPTWVEVDLDVISGNMRKVRSLVGPHVKVIACVKAQAYGYGSVACSRTLIAAGADMLAVGNLEEGVRLRREGIKNPTLVFASSLDEALPHYLEYDLIPTVFDIETARRFSALATRPSEVYVKVETGLGRLGVFAEEAAALVRAISALPKIRVGGIYTHFGGASAGDDKAYAEWQFERFTHAIDELAQHGIDIPVRQAANSPAIVDMPGTYLNAVCPGAALYGLAKGDISRPEASFTSPLIGLKSCLIQVRRHAAGSISGGRVLHTGVVAGVVPMGHSDGYSTLHSKGSQALVRGQRVPVVGVSLENVKLLTTEVPDAALGDDVVFIGKQGKDEIRLSDIAMQRRVQEREVLGVMVGRLPYVYFSNDKPVWLSWKFGEVDLSAKERGGHAG